MKQLAFFTILVAACMVASTHTLAQKEMYDVVSYSIPRGWKKEVKENGVQIYTGNDKTGEYTLALIIKSTLADGLAGENFTAMWEKLVKGTVTVAEAPVMNEPSKGKGWEIISGQAHYTDGSNKGLVTLITATGGGRLATMVLMANTDKYQQELQELIRSVELSEIKATRGGAGDPAPVNTNAALTGKTWEVSTKEKFVGGAMNGYYTGGFFTYQYKFAANGTYRFVYVAASAYTDANVLQYETGSWSINGNQLTIAPARGSNEEWSVAGGPVKLAAMSDVQIDKIKRSWDKKIKTGKRTLEKYTYPFRIEYIAGNKVNALILQYNGKTLREGNGNTIYYFETPAEKSILLPAALP